MSPIAPSIAPTVHALPVFSQWNNPIPNTFSQLDGRNHILTNGHHRFLEMHPKGVRTVVSKTEYCILTMMILNFSRQIDIDHWDAKNKKDTVFNDEEPIHLIRSNKTGKYLCMNNQSVIYQADKNTSECHFRQELGKDKLNTVRYYRYGKTRNRPRHWFIEFNKDNTVRCGNTTSRNHKGANFHKIAADKFSTTSPPFQGHKNKACCTKKLCKRRRDRVKKTDKKELTDVEKVRKKSCKKLTRFCKKSRRNFFKLSLKKLRRYYKRCIKNRDDLRKCKDYR